MIADEIWILTASRYVSHNLGMRPTDYRSRGRAIGYFPFRKYTGEFFAPSLFSNPVSVKCRRHFSAALGRKPKCCSRARRVMQLFSTRYSFILSRNSSSVYCRDFDENLARSNRTFFFTSLSSSASGRNLMLRTLISSPRTFSRGLPSGRFRSTDNEK